MARDANPRFKFTEDKFRDEKIPDVVVGNICLVFDYRRGGYALPGGGVVDHATALRTATALSNVLKPGITATLT